MKIKLAGKAKIIAVITVFAVALTVGLLLENLRNDKFTVETIHQESTDMTTEDEAASDMPDKNDAETTVTAAPEATAAPETPETPIEASLPAEDVDMVIDGKININTADAETLMRIKGIGESLSQRIITYRTEHGPFEAIEEIVNVNGIGAKKFEDMRDMICVK